jgi:hypothetical protein
VWRDGEIIWDDEGDYVINFFPDELNESKMIVQMDEAIEEMHQKVDYDLFITSVDRLQMLIIPEKPNRLNPGIDIFKSYFGPTRKYFDFDELSPFCCNVFLINNFIVKVTFSFSNPLSLIEFE